MMNSLQRPLKDGKHSTILLQPWIQMHANEWCWPATMMPSIFPTLNSWPLPIPRYHVRWCWNLFDFWIVNWRPDTARYVWFVLEPNGKCFPSSKTKYPCSWFSSMEKRLLNSGHSPIHSTVLDTWLAKCRHSFFPREPAWVETWNPNWTVFKYWYCWIWLEKQAHSFAVTRQSLEHCLTN